MKRAWVKLHINGMLNGSVRYQLLPEERATWIDLLCFAALGPEPGLISDNDRRAFPLPFLANRFNIPLPLLETTLKKCQEEGRITVEDGIIRISNWSFYQSEYQRQQASRKKIREKQKPFKIAPAK